MSLTNLEKYGDFSHQSTQLSRAMRKDGGGNYYLALQNFVPASALTVTIYNVTISNDDWTKLPAAATLSNVLSFDISEEDGKRFHYAYEASPSAYKTVFGWTSRNKDISAIWVKRPVAETLKMQLEVWSL